MSTSRILTSGGFDKVPLNLQSKDGQKVRLYCLTTSTEEKIAQAKAALFKELEKQYTYEGLLEKFEEEIKTKPYLLKVGKTLHLLEGKEESTTEKGIVHQVSISQKVSYKFLGSVDVGGNFTISGEHATVVMNIAVKPIQRVLVAKARESLEQFYQEQDSYIKRRLTLSKETALPISIESFTKISIVPWNIQVDAEKKILSESSGENVEKIFNLSDKETISPQDILKFKKEDQSCCILIVGRPGIGKSTLFQYWGWQWWSPHGVWKKNFDLVFKIDLGKLPISLSRNQGTLEELLFDEFFKHRNGSPIQSSKEIGNLLSGTSPKRVLFLLDGYDEFPSNSLYRSAIDQRLLNNQRYYNVILTSRSYKQPLDKNFDAVLECMGLTLENIPIYLQKLKPQKAGEIGEYIKTSPALRTLAHVPLLLEMISESWEELRKRTKTTSLTRTELYETMHTKMSKTFAAKQLVLFPGIKQEEITKKLEQAEKFTAELAFRVMESGNTLFEQDILEETKEHCGFYDIDSLLEPGFINGRSASQEYYFPHLTLQEYWAAKHLAQALRNKNPEDAEIIFHDKEGDIQWISVKEFIANNKYNPRYSQIWEFVAGILGKYAKNSASCKGNKEPLQRFLKSMLEEEPFDLLNLYHLRFMALLNEADVREELKGVNQLIALYNSYFKARLSGELKTNLSSDTKYIVPADSSMKEELFEKLIFELGVSMGHIALEELRNMIANGQIVSPKAIKLLGEALIQEENTMKSSRAATVLDRLAQTTQKFPDQIKAHLKKILVETNHPLQIDAIPILARLVKSDQMAATEMIYPLIGLLENPSEEIKQAVGRAFEEMAHSGKLPPLAPVDLRKILENQGLQVLLAIAKTHQKFPPDLLETLVSQAIESHGSIKINILETIVQFEKQLPTELVEKIIQSQSAELLKSLVTAGLILSDCQMERVFNDALDGAHSGPVRSSLIDVLEMVVKNGYRFSAKLIQTLIDTILASAAPMDTHAVFFYTRWLLKQILRAGQVIEDEALDQLSNVLEKGTEYEQIGTAKILELVAKTKKLPPKIISILQKTLHQQSLPDLLGPIILALTDQSEEITSEDLPRIVQLIETSFPLTSEYAVFTLLQKLLEEGFLFPPNLDITERLQRVLLQKRDKQKQAFAVKLLNKLSTIPTYASAAENALQMVIKELIIKTLQDDIWGCAEAISVMKVIASIEPNFPPETMTTLERLLHKGKFFRTEVLELLRLLVRAGVQLSKNTLLALGGILLETNELPFFAAGILASTTANGQKLPDETLKALLLLILYSKSGSAWSIAGKMCIPAEPALSAIGNVASTLPDWVESSLAEVLEKDEESARFNALRILDEIAWNRKTLSGEIIALLLPIVAQKGTKRRGRLTAAAVILRNLDLSSELILIKKSNLALGLVADILVKTPLENIVKSKVFTPEEAGWLFANRLIERGAALFLNGTKLSFFENNKLHEIPLTQEEIDELLPHIHAAASSQIGIKY